MKWDERNLLTWTEYDTDIRGRVNGDTKYYVSGPNKTKIEADVICNGIKWNWLYGTNNPHSFPSVEAAKHWCEMVEATGAY